MGRKKHSRSNRPQTVLAEHPARDDEQSLVATSLRGPVIVNVAADDRALDAFAAEGPSPEPTASGLSTAEFGDALVHAYPTENRDGMAPRQRGLESVEPVRLDAAALRVLFDVTLDDAQASTGDRFQEDDWNAASARSSVPPGTAHSTRTPGSTAWPAATSTSRFAYEDRFARPPLAAHSVRLAPSHTSTSFSWLRATARVVMLVAIGVAIALGTGYLPVTGPETVATIAEIVAPDETTPPEIARQSLPEAPPAPSPTLTSPAAAATAPRIPLPAAPPPVTPGRPESTTDAGKPVIVPPPAREPYLGAERPPNEIAIRTSPPIVREAMPTRPSTTPAPLPSPPVASTEPPVTQPARDVTQPSPAPAPSPATAPPQATAVAPQPAANAQQPSAVTPQPPAVADATPPPVRAAAEPARPGATTASEVSATQRDEVEIRRLLDEYRQAYGRLDAARTATLWPGVDAAALSRAFSTIARQDVEFEQCAVEVNGQRAAAKCRGSLEYVRRVGNTSPQLRSMSWTFVFDRSSGRWLINRVTAQ